jgi:hypothetical protein
VYYFREVIDAKGGRTMTVELVGKDMKPHTSGMEFLIRSIRDAYYRSELENEFLKDLLMRSWSGKITLQEAMVEFQAFQKKIDSFFPDEAS